jgi:competence protein ComEC
MRIHFIDVGQADNILVEIPDGKAMLIDAGNNGDSDMIVDYI